MKYTTITREIYLLPVSINKSASLFSQEKVQQSNLQLFILYPKTKTMRTIFTFMLALFIHATLFSQVTSFTSSVKNDRVDLTWATAAEKNISHFVIEKSMDGKNYSQAGIVFAYGNTSATMNYPFFEKNPRSNNEGVIYYRLSEITNDGFIAFTQVTKVSIGNKSEQTIGNNSAPAPLELVR